MLPNRVAIFVLILLTRHIIAFLAACGAFWANLHWMTKNDVDWRMRNSWAAFLVFVIAALADAWTDVFHLPAPGPAWFGPLEFGLLAVCLLLCFLGRGAGRIFIGVGAAVVGFIYIP